MCDILCDCLCIIWGVSQRIVRFIRNCLRAIGAERPTTTLFLVIGFSVTVLPFVTAAALMPLTILLDLTNTLSTKGLVYVFYSLFFQVTTLAVIILFLFISAFTVATCATMVHKYLISK